MVYSERELKIIVDEYKKQLSDLTKRNELKDKDIKNLNSQLKQKDEIIQDLDKENCVSECKALREEVRKLKKKVNELEELLGIAQKSMSKDSSNSCKPSSTNGFKIVKQNNRVKSGRKPGQLKGHAKSSPSVSENPDEVIRVSKVATCTCGHKTLEQEEVRRDVVYIKIIKYTKQYIGVKTVCPHCHKVHSPKFPDGVNNPVNYDNGVKSLIVYLNTYCNVPNNKVSDLLSFLTHKEVNITPSLVTNTLASFNKKSETVLEYLKKCILKSPVINEDETPIKVNGKLMSIIGTFTKKITYMQAFENRKYESFVEMGIVDKYFGTVCHDHNRIHNSFENYSDAECNFHILRYCKGEYETHKWESIHNFMNYLLSLRDIVDSYKLDGKDCIPSEEYENIKKEYLRLLDLLDEEYNQKADKNRPKYYNTIRCLKTRIREYVDDHLRFLTDFRIEFTNNLAERRIKTCKKETKNCRMLQNLKICQVLLWSHEYYRNMY